jgi:FixJ family two-component response regulator
MTKDDPIVFVVDDDSDVRASLTDLLDSIGLRSEVFASTADFLSGGRTQEASCLILDVRLPGLSGLDLQTELNSLAIETPIIFITGHGDIPMTVRAMKAGAVEFLTKPIQEQQLLDAVFIALDRDRAMREEQGKTHHFRTTFEALSPRDQEVMRLATNGLMNKQIAATMGVSEVTVKVHRRNVMKKFGIRSLADLVRIADTLKIARSSSTPL